MKKENDLYCYLCMFILLIVLSFCLIGEETKPQDVKVTNTDLQTISQKGEEQQ